MKERFFWIALCLIGISWIVNSMFALSKQLDEPIFLDHYIETVMQENVFLTFYYLTNINDTSSISYVNIDGVTSYVVQDDFFDGFGFNSEPRVNLNMQSFTHYALRNIQLELNQYDLENSLIDGQFTFNEIDVFFNDGKSITVPIGEVTIMSDYPNSTGFIEMSSSSSSDGSSEDLYKAEESLSIENITMKYGEIFQEQLLVKLDFTNKSAKENPIYMPYIPNWDEVPGTDIQNIELPYNLEKNETLSIYTQLGPNFVGFMESFIKLSGTTTSGKSFTTYSPIYTQQPYLEPKDVDAIILKKSKGGS